MAQTEQEIGAAKDTIWAMEQSIYEGRARGDLSAYRNNVAPRYLAWPPTTAIPIGAGNLPTTVTPSQERLTMEFRDFSMNGDTAVIYYVTHRTQRYDGTASDDHFETTHTWLKRDGKWVVFAGMARIAPQR